MALKPCKECKKEVSTTASTCPHCGVKNPAISGKETLYGLVGLAAIVAVTVAMCTDSDEDKAKAKAAAAAVDAACAKDLQCQGDKGTVAAGLFCADDVERLAKHSVKWTDGTLEPKFSRFRWTTSKQESITFIGDKATFQNGFGAFTPVIYECDMAADLRTVLNVRVSEGRLPR